MEEPPAYVFQGASSRMTGTSTCVLSSEPEDLIVIETVSDCPVSLYGADSPVRLLSVSRGAYPVTDPQLVTSSRVYCVLEGELVIVDCLEKEIVCRQGTILVLRPGLCGALLQRKQSSSSRIVEIDVREDALQSPSGPEYRQWTNLAHGSIIEVAKGISVGLWSASDACETAIQSPLTPYPLRENIIVVGGNCEVTVGAFKERLHGCDGQCASIVNSCDKPQPKSIRGVPSAFGIVLYTSLEARGAYDVDKKSLKPLYGEGKSFMPLRCTDV